MTSNVCRKKHHNKKPISEIKLGIFPGHAGSKFNKNNPFLKKTPLSRRSFGVKLISSHRYVLFYDITFIYHFHDSKHPSWSSF